MDTIKEWAQIARDLGFPALVTIFLMWMYYSRCKELYDKIHAFALTMQETCVEIKGLRSDVQELYRAILYGRMYEREYWARGASASEAEADYRREED